MILTTSYRLRDTSTPSIRHKNGDDVASMAWGALNKNPHRSAPSIATSNRENSSKVVSGMPNSSACSFVLTEVGTAIMSFSVPSLSNIPSRSTANAAVEPVPRPTFMPLVT